tara:strand:+ start:209 stop:1291 length:1083 start_codon:yes stop_codon:yes gene_type:complete
MAYSSIVKPTDYFNTVLWTGDNTARTISGVGFQPDWIWWKQRNGTDSHRLADAVRGEGSASYKLLFSEDTSAEYDGSDNGGSQGNINAITSDGFSGVQGTSGYNNWNGSSYNYVAWNWLGANGTASNGDGSITSTVSANVTAGFSIVKYTSNNTAGATIGHGLGSVPKMVIVKSLANTTRWFVYHSSLGNGSEIYLDDTQAAYNSATVWNNTTPTSSVVTLGTTYVNASGDYIAYCFAEKQGYSKFGSYTGNGIASGGGPFIHLGFKPAFFLLKESSGSDNWTLMDNKRLGYNPRNDHLFPNATTVEYATDRIDMVSNGIKIIDNDGSINQSGQTYIYMAFAENPFVANDSGTAVPVTAR